MFRHIGIAVLLVSFAACHHTPAAVHAAGSANASSSPLAFAELRTTDGAIALGNLQGQIDGEERLAAYRPLTVTQRAGIAELIASRGQFLGRIADYERADDIAEQLVRDAPGDARAFLARAKARAVFHRFTAALQDLAEADRLRINQNKSNTQRAAIFQAVGRYDEAFAIRHAVATVRPDISSLGAEASVRADRGEIAAAQQLYVAAQHYYRDVSPFPVVWLYFQQGLMWMREGNLERARELFAAAHLRLPEYAAAQGHLAEVEAALGQTDSAIELLRPLAEASDDPDYAAQLARILHDAKRPTESRPWRDVAAARYDELMARHPEAFADHAAEFWLGAGDDATKALAFAQTNLENRPTARAYELVLQAALAARQPEVACLAATHVRALAHVWPSLDELAGRASVTCPGPQRKG